MSEILETVNSQTNEDIVIYKKFNNCFQIKTL